MFLGLIKFMAVYLLAFVIAYLLARDMLMVSYICPCLVKFLIVTFLFLRQLFASHLRGFCYLVHFLQLAPLQGISLRVLVNWLEAQIQPDLCSGLLQGSCPFFFCKVLVLFLASSVTYIFLGRILLLSHFFCDLHPFRDLVVLFGFDSNLHSSGWNLVTWPFLVFVTYTLLGILSFFWLR